MGPDPFSTLLILSALCAAGGFVYLYATNSPWQVTNVGKAMMTLAVSLVGLCLTGLVFNLVGPDNPFWPALRNLSWVGLNLSLWWQLVNLLIAQRTDNQERPPVPPPAEVQDNDLFA